MNLLIALMASTYEVALENTVVERLIDKYNLVRDASYVCFSGICFCTVFLIVARSIEEEEGEEFICILMIL